MVALAKLSRPTTQGVVLRERLFAQLDQARELRALWLSGPPGAGKTTLAASWLIARGADAIWYQADPGDADPASFFYYLREGAAEAGLPDKALLPLLTAEHLPDVASFSRNYFRALFASLRQPIALVLDNYQDVAEGAAFHAIVRDAITEAPEGVFIIVASRAEAPPGYARLIASRRLASLGFDELRLTRDEAMRIATDVHVHHIGTVDELVERCEGWAGGLTLLLAHARAAGTTPIRETHVSREALFDYFGSELFDASPPELRHLLLQTALVPWCWRRPKTEPPLAQI